MHNDSVQEIHRVTRYNLVITFEELYTTESRQLDASANAIGEIVHTIQHLVAGDPVLQAMLEAHQLTLNIVAPTRVATPLGKSPFFGGTTPTIR